MWGTFPCRLTRVGTYAVSGKPWPALPFTGLGGLRP
jgi:hypothetical protein